MHQTTLDSAVRDGGAGGGDVRAGQGGGGDRGGARWCPRRVLSGLAVEELEQPKAQTDAALMLAQCDRCEEDSERRAELWEMVAVGGALV